MKLKKVAEFIVMLFVTMFTANVVCAADTERVPFQNKVITRDTKGRVNVMEVTTPYGSCMSQVIYNLGPEPQIHVVVITPTGMKNIGHLVLKNRTWETSTDAVLMLYFKMVNEERCLPKLIPTKNKM